MGAANPKESCQQVRDYSLNTILPGNLKYKTGHTYISKIGIGLYENANFCVLQEEFGEELDSIPHMYIFRKFLVNYEKSIGNAINPTISWFFLHDYEFVDRTIHHALSLICPDKVVEFPGTWDDVISGLTYYHPVQVLCGKDTEFIIEACSNPIFWHKFYPHVNVEISVSQLLV